MSARPSGPELRRPAAGPFLLVLGGIGLGLLVGVVAPVSPGAGRLPPLLGALACAVLAAVVWALRARPGALWWLLVVAVGLDGGVVALSQSLAGLILATTGYIYLVLYGAFAFDRTRLRVLETLVVVTSLIATAASEPGLRPTVWLATVGPVVVAGEVLGRAMRLLRWYAATDSLTGALTRAAFREAARTCLAGARRCGTPTTLVLVDLDHFKAVNDTHGHAAGDDLLVATVAAWRARLRGQDELGRVGGDEFVLLLPDTDADGACRLLTTLRPVSPVEFSAGVAEARDGESLEELLARADASLYEWKRRRPVPGLSRATSAPP